MAQPQDDPAGSVRPSDASSPTAWRTVPREADHRAARLVDSVVAGSLADVAFAFTLSADDTVRTKPHPDPYRAAAGRFGAPPGACVAVEDSPDGTVSAEAAGCPVLVVPSLLPVAAGEGRYFAGSLADVDLAVLEGVILATSDRSFAQTSG